MCRSPTRRRSRAWRRWPARPTRATRACWPSCPGAIWCRRSGCPTRRSAANASSRKLTEAIWHMLTRNQPFALAGSGDDEICGGIHRVSPRGAARPRDPNAVRRGRGRIANGSDRLGHVSRHGDREPHAAEGARGVRRQRRPRVDRRRRGAQARGQRAPSPSSSPSSRPSRRPTSPPARRRSKGSPDPVRPAWARSSAVAPTAIRLDNRSSWRFDRPWAERRRSPSHDGRSRHVHRSRLNDPSISSPAALARRSPSSPRQAAGCLWGRSKNPPLRALTVELYVRTGPAAPTTRTPRLGHAAFACASPPRAAFRTERFLDGAPSSYAWRLALPRRAVRRDGDACRARGAPPAPGTTFRVRRSRTGRTATSRSCRPSAPGCSPAAAGRVVPPLARGHLAGSRRVDWGGERR